MDSVLFFCKAMAKRDYGSHDGMRQFAGTISPMNTKTPQHQKNNITIS